MQSHVYRAACAALLLGLSHTPAQAGSRADSHAPIGVMAEHFHQAGEWMLSYRYMHMQMRGNRKGGDRISPDTIATTEPNRFADRDGQPPTLRVVPLQMDMDMHMFGMMYAPTERLTLMAMTSLVEKSMRHLTYQGGSGSDRLGRFTTQSSGLGDTRLAGLFALMNRTRQRLHLIAGLGLPTGSITERDRILAPDGSTPNPRLPYPMQLGSGSTDLLAGLSWAGHAGAWGWGAQYDATLRLQDNDEDYRLGDVHAVTGWLSRSWSHAASSALRLTAADTGRIDGMDPAVVAPVQTADPVRQGGRRVSLGLSLNLAAGHGSWSGQRLALEYQQPVWRDLNGPQLERSSSLTLGWQFAF